LFKCIKFIIICNRLLFVFYDHFLDRINGKQKWVPRSHVHGLESAATGLTLQSRTCAKSLCRRSPGACCKDGIYSWRVCYMLTMLQFIPFRCRFPGTFTRLHRTMTRLQWSFTPFHCPLHVRLWIVTRLHRTVTRLQRMLTNLHFMLRLIPCFLHVLHWIITPFHRTLHVLHWIVTRLHRILTGLHFMLRQIPRTLFALHWAVTRLQRTVTRLHFTLHPLHRTLTRPLSILNSLHRILTALQFILKIIRRTIYAPLRYLNDYFFQRHKCRCYS